MWSLKVEIQEYLIFSPISIHCSFSLWSCSPVNPALPVAGGTVNPSPSLVKVARREAALYEHTFSGCLVRWLHPFPHVIMPAANATQTYSSLHAVGQLSWSIVTQGVVVHLDSFCVHLLPLPNALPFISLSSRTESSESAPFLISPKPLKRPHPHLTIWVVAFWEADDYIGV